MTSRRAKPRRRAARAWAHQAVLALINEEPDSDDAEEIVRRRARNLVAQALSMGWSGPPFDPEVLAGIRGIHVIEGSAELEHDALIRPRRDRSLEIVWNPLRPSTRRRYSICHEIVHTFFPDAYDVIHYRSRHKNPHDANDELEMLCDIGASELLLPWDAFAGDVGARSADLALMDELRDRYEASREAVLLRMAQVTPRPMAAAILSYRHKPTEEREFSQASFYFRSPPPRRLRVDLMTVSAAFLGSPLPRHKSVPDESAVYRLLGEVPPERVEAIETWNSGKEFLPPTRIEAMPIPSGLNGDRRVAVMLSPEMTRQRPRRPRK